MTKVIESRGLSKSFFEEAGELKVLTGIDCSIAAGEQIAIMGRSGSGKSTLLQLWGGLDTPTGGEVFLDGHNLSTLTEKERETLRNQRVGFIFQFHHLLPEFSALENVAMPLLLGKLSPKKAKQKALELLDKVGLKHRLTHRPAQLSGGERQRVAIARALVNNPAVVFADEPTGNLDNNTADEIFELIQDIHKEFNTTFVIVTHDQKLADKMDRTLIVQNGVLEAVG